MVELTPDELIAMYRDRRVLRDPATFLATLSDLRPGLEEDDAHPAPVRVEAPDLPACTHHFTSRNR